MDASRRVFIIDDERDFAASLADILESRGYAVRLAHSAADALQGLESFAPDVCLVDVRLGTSNGVDLIGDLKAGRPDLICLVMTAYADTTSAIRALQNGAYDYLRKPVPAPELLATLERCFGHVDLGRARAAAETALRERNEELARINARLKDMVEAAERLTACRTESDLDMQLLEEFSRSMAARGGSLLANRGDHLYLVGSLDGEHVPVRIALPAPAGSVIARVMESREPLLVADVAGTAGLQASGWTGYQDGSLLALPLMGRNGSLLGILTLHNKAWPPFTPQDLELARILISLSEEILVSLRAREDLRRSEERFRHLIEDASDLTTIVDSGGKLRYVSPSVERVLGHPADRLQGTSIVDVLDPESLQGAKDDFAEIVRSPGRVVVNRSLFRHVDGGVRVLESIAKNLLDDPIIQGIIVNSRDITEQQAAARALQESENKYRALFDAAADAILVFSETACVDCNAQAERLFAATRRELLAAPLDSFAPERQPDKRDSALSWRSHVADAFSGATPHFDWTHRRQDGTTFDAEVSLSRIELRGSPCVQAIIRDVTEQKTARRREKHREEQLYQAAKMVALGTLVSGVAHEINNPNNFIRLNAENLNDLWPEIRAALKGASPGVQLAGMPLETADRMMRDMLKGLLEGSRRIEQLVTGLRDFARKDQGEVGAPVDVNSVIDSAVAIVSATVRKATSRFSRVLAQDLPPVIGNYQQIEQVVINFLTNACQALIRRDQAIEIRSAFDPDLGEVLVCVRDEGMGIAPEHLGQITDPFFTTKRDIGGTGLGLSVSYQIAENHGGKLEFQSQLGAGTTARLRLPARGEQAL
jgi:PAS domain S-box-containing protein